MIVAKAPEPTVAGTKTESFYMQSAVTEVKIPATVKVIGMSAFQESGITTITLPDILTRIDNNAFRRCSSLKTMIAQQASRVLREIRRSTPAYRSRRHKVYRSAHNGFHLLRRDRDQALRRPRGILGAQPENLISGVQIEQADVLPVQTRYEYNIGFHLLRRDRDQALRRPLCTP